MVRGSELPYFLELWRYQETSDWKQLGCPFWEGSGELLKIEHLLFYRKTSYGLIKQPMFLFYIQVKWYYNLLTFRTYFLSSISSVRLEECSRGGVRRRYILLPHTSTLATLILMLERQPHQRKRGEPQPGNYNRLHVLFHFSSMPTTGLMYYLFNQLCHD